MITIGSISRDEAARKFYFLEEGIRGRRKAINELTHKDPDLCSGYTPTAASSMHEMHTFATARKATNGFCMTSRASPLFAMALLCGKKV